MIIAAIIAIAVVVAVVVLVAGRTRRAPDDIATFRRQIDALSPEARRRTSERMKPSEQASTDDDDAHDQ